MRAVVLALSASHYLHTARDNAGAMLATCEQLAAGLGASAKKDTEGDGPKKPKDAVGNAHLRLWVGERFLGAFPFFYLDCVKKALMVLLSRAASMVRRHGEGGASSSDKCKATGGGREDSDADLSSRFRGILSYPIQNEFVCELYHLRSEKLALSEFKLMFCSVTKIK